MRFGASEMNRSILAGTVTLRPASSVTCLASCGSGVGIGFWTEHASRTKAHKTNAAVAIDLAPGCVDGVTNKNPADPVPRWEQAVGGTQ